VNHERKYPSSVDVAKLAGVSQSAVSRTFTEGASVSAETRRKVERAAEQLGYRPSLIPRIMLTNQSQLVAIVIGEMHNPFYASVLEGFSRRLQERGKTILLFQVDHGEYIDEIVPILSGYRVDGVISALSLLSNESATECAKMRIPVVMFNGRLRNDWVSSVCCDNVGGGRAIANVFLQEGAKRFAYISGLAGNLASEERAAGFFGRVIEAGSSSVRMAQGNFRYEGGYRAAVELMTTGERPDAIFCANDLSAIGAIEAIRTEFGLSVPEDVIVAGFDDIPSASWPSLSVTTIRSPGAAMIESAISIIDAAQPGSAKAPMGRMVLIPGELVERRSTARRPRPAEPH
jgi:DNA-binding LacI/PurR family transcriptional regulator